ncbi:hypothetical protein JOL62DRAFT_552823 [Phyllosticta paracitricarpa]|uniref:Maturase K n=1 Tax=Phyllosticta paracitricarpa TaxID=2016321 RepID=A0ABR1NKV2_9PEZI
MRNILLTNLTKAKAYRRGGRVRVLRAYPLLVGFFKLDLLRLFYLYRRVNNLEILENFLSYRFLYFLELIKSLGYFYSFNNRTSLYKTLSIEDISKRLFSSIVLYLSNKDRLKPSYSPLFRNLIILINNLLFYYLLRPKEDINLKLNISIYFRK